MLGETHTPSSPGQLASWEFPYHCQLAPFALQGGPSLGTLRQAVTLLCLPSLPALPLQALPTVTFNKGQARSNGTAQKQRGLGVGWQGACLELVRAGTPCQDKVRSCPPLTAHPVWPLSALPTHRASRRLKITEASLYRSRSLFVCPCANSSRRDTN